MLKFIHSILMVKENYIKDEKLIRHQLLDQESSILSLISLIGHSTKSIVLVELTCEVD